ncbi:MAG: N-acetylmuramoyl-L-alanine amidase [Candidatus Saccharicenans sp.]|jgi:N-acetylmuramoyl-L-alanine amidase|nr:N-acetylmuramoyl-L-alanine amidase [Candidatus Saccharicenans sp.]MDH7494185.1 N-acetylmuramoyl-L-alanine amidase [Candidatus Saccharicenans sp.]
MPKAPRVITGSLVSFLISVIAFSSLLLLPLLAQKKSQPVPFIKVEVADISGGSRLKISSNVNLNYSLRKTGTTLTVSIRSSGSLRFDRAAFHSQLVTSVDLAKSPEAYLLLIKTRTPDFSYTQSARWNPFELTIELKDGKEQKAPVENRPATQEKPAEVPSQPQAVQSDQTASPTVTARKQVKTIVIDPGHGGNETGAKGAYGTLEKDITLSVSRKLKEAIERGLKYRVVMTREADISVPLERRAAIANNNKADLFISIHVNGSRRTRATGSETFFLSLNASDEESRRLAYFENNSQELENRMPEKDFDDLKMILWDMAQSAYLKQSSQLAELVQQELNELLNTRNRGVKQAPFKVLTGAACPAILVEVAFITNPEEEKMLQSEDFQSRVAEAIYRGLNRFLQLYEKP